MATFKSIEQVKKIESTGPWKTKSHADLNVLFSLNYDDFQSFISYDADELALLRTDIRGVRSYQVSNIQKGSIGANEWHKVRNELVFVTQGSVKWTVTDNTGQTAEYILRPNTFGILNPATILHTYEALENDTTILVFANTLFLPNDESTHDTFSKDTFPYIH